MLLNVSNAFLHLSFRIHLTRQGAFARMEPLSATKVGLALPAILVAVRNVAIKIFVQSAAQLLFLKEYSAHVLQVFH